MKKYFVAAIFGGLGADAVAQSDKLTVYGAFDAGITYVNNSGVSNKRAVRMDSGTLYGNRLGFRGSEELGGGNQAIFLAESGFALDNGATTQGGTLFGRQLYVGFRSVDYGTLVVGRPYALDVDMAPYYSAVGHRVSNFNGMSHWADQLAPRVNNAVRYVSPSYGGLRFGALVGLGEQAGNSRAGRTVNAGVNYTGDALAVGATYLQINNLDGSRLTGVTLVSGEYKLGATTLHLAYTDTRGIDADVMCFSTCAARPEQLLRTYDVGLTYRLTPVNHVYSGISHTRLMRDMDGHALQFNLGAFHDFSKRTGLYALWSLSKTGGLGGFSRAVTGASDFGPTAFVTNPQGTPDRGRQWALRLGMTHRF